MVTQTMANQTQACLAPTARHSMLSLGQAPQDPENKKKSALKVPLIDTRFQRLVAGVIRIPGAMPQSYVRKAPMALKPLCLL
jgi:ABC-type iron transport system FetAB permease component